MQRAAEYIPEYGDQASRDQKTGNPPETERIHALLDVRHTPPVTPGILNRQDAKFAKMGEGEKGLSFSPASSDATHRYTGEPKT